MFPTKVKQECSLSPYRGQLQYITQEYSFSFAYNDDGSTRHRAWLSFGPIEVAVDCSTGQLLDVSGYVGPRLWERSTLSLADPTQASALILEDANLCEVGIGYTADGTGFDKVKFNADSGWAHIGNTSASIDATVEFATNCCAAISDNRVVAIWLHPDNWQELV